MAPGAPGPNADCTSSYPTRDESVVGTTLIEGMPVSRPITGIARMSRIAAAIAP